MKRLGLKTIIISMIFWYGLSLLNYNNNNIINLNDVYFLIFLFLIFFLFGYFIFYRKYLNDTEFIPIISKPTFLFLLLFFLILLYINFNFTNEGLIKNSYSLTAFSALLIYAYLGFEVSRGISKILYLIIIILIILNLLDEYSRRYLLEAFLAVVYFYVVKKDKYNLFDYLKLIFLSLLAILSFLYLTGLRITSIESAIIDNIVAGIDFTLYGFGFDCIYLTDFVINFYSNNNYLKGETFFAGFFNFIPRAIWPSKPIAFSIILSSDYYSLNIENIFTNFGPGIIAEAYANGGYFFTILTSILFGISIAKFDSYVDNQNKHLMVILSAMIVYPSLFFIVRGDFVNGFYDLYSRLLIVYILYYLSNKIFSTKNG